MVQSILNHSLMNSIQNLWLFDEKKLLILKALWGCSDDMNGCDITILLKIRKNLLSYHIKKLKDAGLILEKKSGRNKHYVLNPEQKEYIKQVLQIVALL